MDPNSDAYFDRIPKEFQGLVNKKLLYRVYVGRGCRTCSLSDSCRTPCTFVHHYVVVYCVTRQCTLFYPGLVLELGGKTWLGRSYLDVLLYNCPPESQDGPNLSYEGTVESTLW